MFISATTTASAYSGISSMTTQTLNEIAPIAVLVLGISIAFLIIETIIDVVAQKKLDARVQRSLDNLHRAEDL